MAIAQVNNSNGTTVGSFPSSVSFSMTTTTGSDMVLVVFAFTTGNDTVTGVTWNGVSLTQQIKRFQSNLGTVYLYTLVNPARNTTANVVISASGGEYVGGAAATYTGVDQTTPVNVTGSNALTETSNNTITLTTTQDGCWLVTGGGAQQTISAGTGLTARGVPDGNWALFDSNGSLGAAGSKSGTMNTLSSTTSVHVGLALQPSGPTTYDKTVTAKARIAKLSNSNTIQAKARILRLGNETITAKAYILGEGMKTIEAKSRIFKPDVEQTITAKARLKYENTQTITALAKIVKTVSNTVTAKAKILAAPRGIVYGNRQSRIIHGKEFEKEG